MSNLFVLGLIVGVLFVASLFAFVALFFLLGKFLYYLERRF